MTLISCCPFFTVTITQKKSRNAVLSLNNGVILCQTAPGLKTTFCRVPFVGGSCKHRLRCPACCGGPWKRAWRWGGARRGEGWHERPCRPAGIPPCFQQLLLHCTRGAILAASVCVVRLGKHSAADARPARSAARGTRLCPPAAPGGGRVVSARVEVLSRGARSSRLPPAEPEPNAFGLRGSLLPSIGFACGQRDLHAL